MGSNYTIQFSAAELFWLASLFGIGQLPLKGNLLPTLSSDHSSKSLKQAENSLLSRNLIRRGPGTSWQVDQLPAALIRWLAGAERVTQAEARTREGLVRQANLFVLDGKGLLVTAEAGQFCFTLTESTLDLVTETVAWLGVPGALSKPGAGKPAFALSQPLEIIQAAWQNHPALEKILQHEGYKPAEMKVVLAWLDEIQWIDKYTQINLVKPPVVREALMCGNGVNTWGGDQHDGGGSLMVKPLSFTGMFAIIQKLL